MGAIYSVISTFRWCEEQRSRQSLLLSIHSIFTRSNSVPMNDLFYCTSAFKEILYLLKKKHIQLFFFCLDACSYVLGDEQLCTCEGGKGRLGGNQSFQKNTNSVLVVACYPGNQSMIAQFTKAHFCFRSTKIKNALLKSDQIPHRLCLIMWKEFDSKGNYCNT